MRQTTRNTVDRLDKPSSYAASKQRKRKYVHVDDNHEEREKTPDFEEKLKDATTLYVGNL
ncbi:nuclear cap binding complex subunit [Botryosphaeria dothidea]